MPAERLPWLVLDTVHDGGPASSPLHEVLAARHRWAHPCDAYPRPVVARRSTADDTVATFLDLEASGWKGRSGTALASRPGGAEFFRQACTALHAERRLQIWRFGTAERLQWLDSYTGADNDRN